MYNILIRSISMEWAYWRYEYRFVKKIRGYGDELSQEMSEDFLS